MVGTSGISPVSPQWVTQLVNQTMAYERQPLLKLQSQRDTLNVKNAIYSDITTKITDLQTAISALSSNTYGSVDAFATKSLSVTNADPNVDVVGASLNGTSAVEGSYSLTVTNLATAHQIGSAQQNQSTVALGYSGTFVIGGASAASVSGNVGSGNPVTGFGLGTVVSGETQLGSDTYSVEFRQDPNNTANWQFRVVDGNGDAVRVDDTTDTGTATTASWQDYSNVSGTTFDTGRGMTITFAATDPTATQLYGGANTATAAYTAQGASITVATTDSLNDILSNINSATYAEGNEVQATVVDRRLVITAQRTGASGAITLDDTSGTVLQDLGILSASGGGTGGTLATGAELRTAKDALFSINNISIQRGKNIGLTDVIQGLSIDLKASGSATIDVAKNNAGVEENVKTLLTKVNDLMDYIKQKTEPTKGSEDSNGNPTYTQAPLGSDWSIRWLRQDIANKLLGEYTGALGNNPKYLTDVGISIDSNGKFTLSDSAALNTALNNDFTAVQSLFDDVLANLNTELDKYNTGTGAIIANTKDSLSTQLSTLNNQIDSYEERLKVRESALRNQYAAVQSQLISMTYQFQSMQAFSAGGLYNSLG